MRRHKQNYQIKKEVTETSKFHRHEGQNQTHRKESNLLTCNRCKSIFQKISFSNFFFLACGESRLGASQHTRNLHVWPNNAHERLLRSKTISPCDCDAHLIPRKMGGGGWNFVSRNLTIWIAGIPFEFPVKGNIALCFNRYSQQRIYSQLLTSDVAAAQ